MAHNVKKNLNFICPVVYVSQSLTIIGFIYLLRYAEAVTWSWTQNSLSKVSRKTKTNKKKITWYAQASYRVMYHFPQNTGDTPSTNVYRCLLSSSYFANEAVWIQVSPKEEPVIGDGQIQYLIWLQACMNSTILCTVHKRKHSVYYISLRFVKLTNNNKSSDNNKRKS